MSEPFFPFRSIELVVVNMFFLTGNNTAHKYITCVVYVCIGLYRYYRLLIEITCLHGPAFGGRPSPEMVMVPI